MPITLPNSFKTEIERPHGRQPLLWLWEIEVARATNALPPIIVRICNHPQSVVWPLSAPTTQTWYPFNFAFTPIEQNQEGDLPQLDLSIDNSTRMLMRYLHHGEGVEGNTAKLFLLPANALTIAYPDHEYEDFDFRIAGVQANEQAIILRLENANFFHRTSPQRRYGKKRCTFEYGGEECGYVVNEVAGFLTCPKTTDACAARGEDHRVRGLPVLHPRRWGAFAGIASEQ